MLFRFLAKPSEEEKIHRELLEVVKIAEVEKGKPQHPIEQAATAKKLSSYAADELRIESQSEEFDPVVIKSRENLKQRILAGRSRLSKLEIELSNITISVQGRSARVRLELNVLGAFLGEEGEFFDRHEVLLELKKGNSGWKLHRAEHIRNLRDREST